MLNLVRSHRPFIEHVRIVIGSSESEERERRKTKRWEKRRQRRQRKLDDDDDNTQSRIRERSQTWACEDGGDNGHIPRDDTTHALEEEQSNNSTKYSRSLSMDVAHHSYNDTNSSVAESLSGAEEEKLEVHQETEDEDKNYHLLFVLDSNASTETFVTDLHRRPCKLLFFATSLFWPLNNKHAFSIAILRFTNVLFVHIDLKLW